MIFLKSCPLTNLLFYLTFSWEQLYGVMVKNIKLETGSRWFLVLSYYKSSWVTLDQPLSLSALAIGKPLPKILLKKSSKDLSDLKEQTLPSSFFLYFFYSYFV